MRIPETNLTWQRDVLCAGLLLLMALAIAYPRSRAGIDWRDEGFLAYGAVRVMNGEFSHRDFVSLQPPLAFYTVASLFKLFGTSLGTFGFRFVDLSYPAASNLRCRPQPDGSTLLFAAAAAACVIGLPYFSLCHLQSGRESGFIRCRSSLSAGRHIKAAMACVAGGIARRRRAFSPARPGDLHSPVDLALVIALGFAHDDSISKTKLKHASLFWLVGIFIVVVPLLAIWWRAGALPDLFRQLVVFPLRHIGKLVRCRFRNLPRPRTCWTVRWCSCSIFHHSGSDAIAAIRSVRSVIRYGFRLREAIRFSYRLVVYSFQVIVHRTRLTF